MPERLWGVGDEPRPLAVQIWDNDPAALAAVGRRLVEEFRPSVLDINFGCPARNVSEKAQSGSYLLRHPDRVGEIVARVAVACRPVPVTAKIRLGCTRDTINAVDVAQAIEAAGGAAVTVHGRTADDFFRGAANWEEIARIKPHLKRIPLIGNGDLRTPAAVVEAMDRYGVDGVMIGRAALGRPWLFAQAAAALRGGPVPPDPTPLEQRQLLLDHFRLVVERFGPGKGTILMRAYACCYGQGAPAPAGSAARSRRPRRRRNSWPSSSGSFPRASRSRLPGGTSFAPRDLSQVPPGRRDLPAGFTQAALGAMLRWSEMQRMKLIARLFLTALAASLAAGAIVYTLRQRWEKDRQSLAEAAENLPHAVVVYCFHPNQKCEKCEKIEKLTHEVLQKSFAAELKDGRVEWRVVNFEEPGNAYFVDKYKLVSTSVVVVNGRPGKDRAWKDYQQQVWELVDDPKAFQDFMRDAIREALK